MDITIEEVKRLMKEYGIADLSTFIREIREFEVQVELANYKVFEYAWSVVDSQELE